MRWVADRDRLLRAVPFALLAFIGQASADWPPGPQHIGQFWISSGLLFLAVSPLVLVRESGFLTWLVSALTYVASVGFLMLATGGVGSGLGALLMLPIVAVALNARGRDSAAVVMAVIATLILVSFATPHLSSITARRAFLFGAVGGTFSVTIHALRRRLRESIEQRATLDERRRIARELHDGLAHELAFISSKTKRLITADDVGPCVREINAAADRALDEARRAIELLTSQHDQTLPAALAQTAEDMGSRLGVAVRVETCGEVEVPPSVTEHLLRIVREAITNAATHGRPTEVNVRLERGAGVRLIVEDDGCGFDPAVGRRSGRFGLLSMEERAASIGARFQIDSHLDGGTRVEVALV